jgi:hypothetical protein
MAEWSRSVLWWWTKAVTTRLASSAVEGAFGRIASPLIVFWNRSSLPFDYG